MKNFKNLLQIKSCKDAAGASLIAAIALIPFQLSTVLWTAPEWGRGFLNPYLNIQLYAYEFFIILSGVFLAIHLKKRKRQIKVGHLSYFALILGWWFLLVFSLAYQSSNPSYALGLVAHSSIYVLLYFLIVNQVTSVRSIVIAFVGSMMGQSLLATYQFTTQSSLGLHLLGEPFITSEGAHLARMNVLGKDWIRAYGTLSHPNVLGGFMSLSMIATFFLTIKKKGLKFLLLSLQFLGLMFSFSRSALLGLILALILMVLLYRKEAKLLSQRFVNGVLLVLAGELLLVLYLRLSDFKQSSSLRLEGIMNAVEIFDSNPLGAGFRSYTAFIDQVSTSAVMPWEYQPVHNIFILLLAEMGIFGLLLGAWFFLFSILKLHQKRKRLLTKQRLQKKRLLLCAILVIGIVGFFDHYWISLSQGLAVLTLFFGLASAFSLDPSQVRSIKKGAPIQQSQIDPTESL